MNDSKEDNLLDRLDIGIYGRPCFGEKVSGDWAYAANDGKWAYFAIVDALGHGPRAHEIAQLTKEVIEHNWSKNVSTDIVKLHHRLKGTGGAAVGLALLNLDTHEVVYTGVGNTVLRKFGNQSKRLVSSEGIVGTHIRTPNEYRMTLKESDIVVLYTDGISTTFDLNEIRYAQNMSAFVLAKKIVKQFGSMYDDATCLVLKVNYEV